MRTELLARGPSYTSLSEHLTEQILGLIRKDNLEPGNRLPSVKELAEKFAVAAPTLREALRRLEAMGVVEIRHGSGIYVCQSMERLMLSNPYYGTLDKQTITDLMAARLLIEPELAELAAHRADNASLSELEQLLSNAEQHLSGSEDDDVALGKINMAFHRGIAAASGNTVLSHVIMSLTELHIKEQMVVLSLYNNRKRDHEQHKGILRAIKGRKPRKARDLMAQHLQDVRAVIEAKL
jgi:GntR family transcriptional regulator, transcriptional repressor for pyruvate dehydrogenase complex